MLHYVVNRASREDRRYLWLGAMAAQGVAMEYIRLQVACDKDDYKTQEELCEVARDEFPEFFGFQLEKPQGHIGLGHLLCSWSCMRMWQCIADSDFWAGAWLDDYALRVRDHRLRELIRELRPDILQLAWHRRDEMFITNYYGLPMRYDVPDTLKVNRKCPAVYVGAVGGADWANILSPRGAGNLLQFMADTPYFNSEVAIPAYYFATRDSRVFSVRANDPAEHGQVPLKRNQWVVQLCDYTDRPASDLAGMHQEVRDD